MESAGSGLRGTPSRHPRAGPVVATAAPPCRSSSASPSPPPGPTACPMGLNDHGGPPRRRSRLLPPTVPRPDPQRGRDPDDVHAQIFASLPCCKPVSATAIYAMPLAARVAPDPGAQQTSSSRARRHVTTRAACPPSSTSSPGRRHRDLAPDRGTDRSCSRSPSRPRCRTPAATASAATARPPRT